MNFDDWVPVITKLIVCNTNSVVPALKHSRNLMTYIGKLGISASQRLKFMITLIDPNSVVLNR